MKYVTPAKASEYLGVSISTLRRWDKEGKIESIRTHNSKTKYKPHQGMKAVVFGYLLEEIENRE